jgi:hypothetical protein
MLPVTVPIAPVPVELDCTLITWLLKFAVPAVVSVLPAPIVKPSSKITVWPLCISTLLPKPGFWVAFTQLLPLKYSHVEALLKLPPGDLLRKSAVA